jgi:hypothetical protein
MSIKDGGPAFPSAVVLDEMGTKIWADDYGYGGMTLRDYFAGQALAGVLASNAEVKASRDQVARTSMIAIACYQVADALLAEREKP